MRTGHTAVVAAIRKAVRLMFALAGMTALVAGAVGWGSDRSADAVTAGGTVTIAEPLTQLGDPVQFDPTLAHTPQVQDPWQMAIYDTLLRPTPENGYLPELATAATITDPQAIAITLRPNVVFSDGTPFDANAVKAGIMRNRNAPQLGGLSNLLQDISSIDVSGPTSLTIHLTAPVAGAFYPLLASQETFIASPTAVAKGDLNTDPVGAGPFVLRQNVPNESITLARNPKYWDAKDIHISELRFVNVDSAPQEVSALEAGEVNVTNIPVSDAPNLQRNGAYRVGTVDSQTQSLWIPVCKSKPPLSDLRVRQALNYAIDRNAINRAVLGGLGESQWALWPMKSIFFPRSLNGYYAYNPAKAKTLLAQAGYPHGFSTQLLVPPGSPVETQVATIVQAEWKQVGVSVSLVQTLDLVSDLYERRVAPMALLPEVRGGIEALTGPFEPGTIGDLCNYDSPTLDGLTAQLGSLPPTSPEAVTLTREAQQYVVSNALAVWISFQPYVYASSTKVTGVSFLTQYAQPIPYYWTLQAQ
jgi:peptide/nickel transport system substrate-binding protein